MRWRKIPIPNGERYDETEVDAGEEGPPLNLAKDERFEGEGAEEAEFAQL